MRYTVTSAEANKLLRKVNEERDMIISNERMVSKFNAAVSEDIEALRPDYDYSEVQLQIAKLNQKIRAIKHAINVFNATTVVGDTGMTIDEILVYIPQLTEKKNKLYIMQMELPKHRARVFGSGTEAVIDYTYANYDIETVKKDYISVSDEQRRIQTALDITNSTVQFDIEIQE